jgi:hypothetical protein
MAAAQVTEKTGSEKIDPGGNEEGFWYDWVNARILYREAASLIGE